MPRNITQVDDIRSEADAQRAFLDWILDFSAVDDAPALLRMLSDCDEPLPREYCQSLGLPTKSSFADAAALLGAPWGVA